MRFTALLHHVYHPDLLQEAYFALKRDASAGVDGETWRSYGESLEHNLLDLSQRLKRGAYRARPGRRAYIAKADGRLRPLGVIAVEDKLVQRATTTVMNAIYEADFLGFSYGFRPGRSQHNALDALYVGLLTKKVNWVLDADIRGFFDAIVVRYADDFVIGFQSKHEAETFLSALKERFAKFGLELHPDKTRLIEFGPWARKKRARRGEGKPETFNFLGFTHICGMKYGNGMFTVKRQTIRQRLTAKLSVVKAELRRRLHEPIPRIGAWLR